MVHVYSIGCAIVQLNADGAGLDQRHELWIGGKPNAVVRIKGGLGNFYGLREYHAEIFVLSRFSKLGKTVVGSDIASENSFEVFAPIFRHDHICDFEVRI